MNTLELKNISTYSDGCKILDNISIEYSGGKVYSITGENESGKSTFAKLLSGLIFYHGRVYLNSKEIVLKRKNKLINIDIAVVHQQNYLQKNLSVIENIFLGSYSSYKKYCGFIDEKKIKKRFDELIAMTQFPVSPDMMVTELSYVQKRMVEVLKSLVLDPKVLVFDTLLGNVTENEKTLFFNCLKELKNRDKIVIYLTHKIKEAILIGDHISVISNGNFIYSTDTAKASKSDIIQSLCTEYDKNKYPHIRRAKGEIVLSCKNLHTDEVKNISFSLFKGEILGITGLVGSGKSSIGKVMSGLQKAKQGEIILFDSSVKIKNPHMAYKYGIGFMTGVNTKDLVPSFNPENNITLSNLHVVSKMGFISDKKQADIKNNVFNNFSIINKVPNILTYKFSAGTQKKLCIAKILFANTKILILNEPTLGIDSASKSDVYNLLIDYVSRGNSIIIISSNFSEISGFADRAIIIKEGTVSGELLYDELCKEKILFNVNN